MGIMVNTLGFPSTVRIVTFGVFALWLMYLAAEEILGSPASMYIPINGYTWRSEYPAIVFLRLNSSSVILSPV